MAEADGDADSLTCESASEDVEDGAAGDTVRDEDGEGVGVGLGDADDCLALDVDDAALVEDSCSAWTNVSISAAMRPVLTSLLAPTS